MEKDPKINPIDEVFEEIKDYEKTVHNRTDKFNRENENSQHYNSEVKIKWRNQDEFVFGD